MWGFAILESLFYDWSGVMYLDDVVVAGLIIVTLTCVVLGYVGYYAYRKIKEDGLQDEA